LFLIYSVSEAEASSDVLVIGDILGGESEEIPFYPACGDLVKFYRTLDEIIATKELPANQHMISYSKWKWD
ncbi:MAG TPA: hypothetical protein VFY68_03910, partial [Nitrososphaeraceae archaeon]|nr:hypothetical protein [Nitrososphaeraceae archaeon]